MRARMRPVPQQSQSQDFLASVSDLMSGLIFIFIITLAVFAERESSSEALTTTRLASITYSSATSTPGVGAVRSAPITT